MSNALFWIALIGVLAWLWLDGARARELATEVARSMCRKRGLQFLDDTVSLQRIGLRWGANGLRLRRMFSFDFSIEGMGRRSAYLILIGTRIEHFDLGLPKALDEQLQREPATPIRPPQPGDTVIPFRPPKKR